MLTLIKSFRPLKGLFHHHATAQREGEPETEIKNMKLDVSKALLPFIYTRHCEFGMLANKLLEAAHECKLEDLKQISDKE